MKYKNLAALFEKLDAIITTQGGYEAHAKKLDAVINDHLGGYAPQKHLDTVRRAYMELSVFFKE